MFKIAEINRQIPATEEDIRYARQRTIDVPEVLVSLWKASNGLINMRDQHVFSTRELVNKNDLLNVRIQLPGYLMIGTSGINGIFMRTSDHSDLLDQSIYSLNPAYIGSLRPDKVADDLRQWVNMNFGG